MDSSKPGHIVRHEQHQVELWLQYKNRGVGIGRLEVSAEKHLGCATGRYSAAGKRATGQYSAAGKRAIEPKRKWK